MSEKNPENKGFLDRYRAGKQHQTGREVAVPNLTISTPNPESPPGIRERYSKIKQERNRQALPAPDHALIPPLPDPAPNPMQEPGEVIGVGNAVLRALAARLVLSNEERPLDESGRRPFKDRILHPQLDQYQDELLRRLRSLYEKIGIKEPIVAPTVDNIRLETTRIVRALQAVGGQGRKIDVETLRLVENLYSGVVDSAKPPSDDERNLAITLLALSPSVSPAQLQQNLRDAVWNRAQAVAVARKDDEQVKVHRQVRSQFDRLSQSPVRQWYIADWLSSYILLTQGEREKQQKVIWGLTPKSIILRTTTGNADYIEIPYADITTPATAGRSTANFLMKVNRVKASDALRSRVGSLLRIPIEKLTENMGGTIQIADLGGNKTYEFFVRDPWGTKALLENVVTAYTNTLQVIEVMRANISDTTSGVPGLIRPNVVMGLMGDRTLLTVPTLYDRGSRGAVVRQLDTELENINRQIAELEKKLAELGPENPKLSRKDSARTRYLKQKYESELAQFREARVNRTPTQP